MTEYNAIEFSLSWKRDEILRMDPEFLNFSSTLLQRLIMFSSRAFQCCKVHLDFHIQKVTHGNLRIADKTEIFLTAPAHIQT